LCSGRERKGRAPFAGTAELLENYNILLNRCSMPTL
jgi:hypothetical protein